MFFPLLDREVTLCIYPDDRATSITARQVAILNSFLVGSADKLRELQEQLLAHWREYDHFYTDDITFEYSCPLDAYDAAEFRWLLIPSNCDADPNCPVLHFRPAWDPEHGADIQYREGKFELAFL